MTLIKCETEKEFNPETGKLILSHEYELWQEKHPSGTRIDFSYNKICYQEKLRVILVNIHLFSDDAFSSYIPLSWVNKICHIRVHKLKKKSPIRRYGVERYSSLFTSLLLDNYHPDKRFLEFSKIFNHPQNPEKTPQGALEHEISDFLKGNNFPKSYQDIQDYIFFPIQKAREAILLCSRQIPNKNIAEVIGDLNINLDIIFRYKI